MFFFAKIQKKTERSPFYQKKLYLCKKKEYEILGYYYQLQ